MKRAYLSCLFPFCLFPCLIATLSWCQPGLAPPPDSSAAVSSGTATHADSKVQARILNQYGRLPLSFEVNHGQADSRVKFLSRTGGYTLFLTGDEAVLALRGRAKNPAPKAAPDFARFPVSLKQHSDTNPTRARHPDVVARGVLRMKLRGANTAAKVTGLDELAGVSNYFIGNDPAKWRTNVPTYAKVKYEEIYSGIDLVYYGNQRQLEYDFIVAPGADPRRIAFDVRGAKGIRRDAQGDLLLKTEMGEDEIRWHEPVVYQEKDGARQPVAARYAITDANRVTFELAKYDTSRPLYIDPLIYSTYLGGSGGDWGYAITVDADGNAYVTGNTNSTDFPITPGAFQTTRSGFSDVFVTKFNSAGSALVYSTYLGGSGSDFEGDSGSAITVDSGGNAYITGAAGSYDFPTTPGAFQTSCGSCGITTAFVTKLSPTGSALIYSTYLGSGGSYDTGDNGSGIAVDSDGNAYVTGTTTFSGFPTTPGAFQTSGVGAFVTKFNAAGSALVYSTLLGGSNTNIDVGSAIAADNSGDAYVTGTAYSTDFPTTPGAFQTTSSGGGDAFVTKFNPTGSGLIYSTYLGGNSVDSGAGIAVDGSGRAYVTGMTQSPDFPVTPGAVQTTCAGGGNYQGCWDAFVAKLNPSGSKLGYSTYLGGIMDDWGTGIAVDSSGHAFVTGFTYSDNFPTMKPLQPSNASLYGGSNAFIAELNPQGSAFLYSTYLGGYVADAGYGIAVDSSGNAYVAGGAASPNFPTMNALQPALDVVYDAFVTKISAEPSEITLVPLHDNFNYFSGQPVGVTSSPQVSVLTNGGSDSLRITSISVTGVNSGDFAQTNNCGTSVAPGASCSITITFTPTAIGNRSAAVSIADSAPTQSVSLTGLGLLFTVTKLTSSVNPSALGKPVTFKATVSSPSGGTPTGTIEFEDGGAGLISKSLKGDQATFTTTKLPLGLNAMTAVYSGDSNYGFSSGTLNQNVLGASTTTTLTSSPNPSTYEQAVTFTAVVASSEGAPPPDGEVVSFMDGKTVLGTATLSSGSASFMTSALVAGTSSVKAVYAGDANLIGSTSKTVEQVVSKAATTTDLTSSQNPSKAGQSVTFTASVVPQYGGTVKGSVTFYDGTTVLKTAAVSGGAAKFTTSKLTPGTHDITATYDGSVDFYGSSGALTQTVN